MSNTFRGEVINQQLPTVTLTDGVTTLVVNPTLSTSANSGTAGVIPVDGYISKGEMLGGRVVKHNNLGLANINSDPSQYPVFNGPVTISMTTATQDLSGNSVTTLAAMSFNGRNPTSKALQKATADSSVINARTNRSRDGGARIYQGSFIIQNSRPGSNLSEIRIRAYKVANELIDDKSVSGVSPNEKSKVLIIRFVMNTASFTLPTNR